MTDYATMQSESSGKSWNIWAGEVGKAVVSHRHYLALCLLCVATVWPFLALSAPGGAALLSRNLASLLLIMAMPLAVVLVLWTAICAVQAGLSHPRETLKRVLAARYLQPGYAANLLTVLVPLAFVLAGFTATKVYIGHLQPFDLDRPIIDWTLRLTGGELPWQFLMGPFGAPWAIKALDGIYYLWFPLLAATFVLQLLSARRPHLRLQFITTLALNWGLLGTFGALALASAGPAFLPELWGTPTPFDGLLQHLHAINGNEHSLMALSVQNGLWSIFSLKGTIAGAGISAMPSIHVAMATTLALLGWRLGRIWGIALTAFAVAIFIGSIMLAFHYALDGIVGAAAAILIWTVSGWMIDRAHPRALEPLPRQD